MSRVDPQAFLLQQRNMVAQKLFGVVHPDSRQRHHTLLPSVPRLLTLRQLNENDSMVVWLRLYPDLAVMVVFDDLAADDQPKTAPLATLGREEGVEDPIEIVRRDPDAVVPELDLDPVFVEATGRDRDPPPFRHPLPDGIDRVVDQI